jgi:hypothetical protein
VYKKRIATCSTICHASSRPVLPTTLVHQQHVPISSWTWLFKDLLAKAGSQDYMVFIRKKQQESMKLEQS